MFFMSMIQTTLFVQVVSKNSACCAPHVKWRYRSLTAKVYSRLPKTKDKHENPEPAYGGE